MPLKEFWYDPHNDEIFRTKEKYIEHIKECAWYRLCERKADAIADRLGWYISKRQDHIRTFEELEEFISENWRLAYDYVSWRNYNSPKHDNPRLVKIHIKPTSVQYEHKEPMLYLSIDCNVEADDRSSVLGWYHWFMSALGFCVSSGGGYSNVNPGKWHLFNQIAQDEYDRQYKEWQEEYESCKVVNALKNTHENIPEFKFKSFYYANS